MTELDTNQILQICLHQSALREEHAYSHHYINNNKSNILDQFGHAYYTNSYYYHYYYYYYCYDDD